MKGYFFKQGYRLVKGRHFTLYTKFVYSFTYTIKVAEHRTGAYRRRHRSTVIDATSSFFPQTCVPKPTPDPCALISLFIYRPRTHEPSLEFSSFSFWLLYSRRLLYLSTRCVSVIFARVATVDFCALCL